MLYISSADRNLFIGSSPNKILWKYLYRNMLVPFHTVKKKKKDEAPKLLKLNPAPSVFLNEPTSLSPHDDRLQRKRSIRSDWSQATVCVQGNEDSFSHLIHLAL